MGHGTGLRAIAAKATLGAVMVLVVGACVPDPGTDPGGTTTTTTPGPTTTTVPGSTTTTTAPPAGGASSLYVALTNLGVIRKIDTATLATVGDINVGGPLGASIAKDGSKIYYGTSSNNSGDVGVYDTVTGTNNRSLLTGFYVPSLRTSPALPGRLFVGESGSPCHISEYDLTTSPPTLLARDVHGSLGGNLQDFEISADGTRIWVACGAPYEITEIRTSDLGLTGKVFPTGAYPTAVASTTAGGTEVLAAGRSNLTPNAFTYAANDPAVVTSWTVGPDVEDRGLGFSRDGSLLYTVVNNSTKSELVTVTRSTGAMTRAPLVNGTDDNDQYLGDLAVDPGTGRVFVTEKNTLAVYNPDGSYGTSMTLAQPSGMIMTATGPTSTPTPLTTTTTTTTTTSTTTTSTSTTTTTTIPNTGPPTISSFAATTASGPAPLSTAFQWAISDPDAAPLTCGIDIGDDGSYETTINNCTSASTRSRTFSTAGDRAVRLRVSDGTTAVTSKILVSVTAGTSDAFGISVRFNGSVTASQQAAVNTAATRWAQVIKAGLSDTSVNLAAGACGTSAPAYNGPIDDLMIDVSVAAIDGTSNVLAHAGPCVTRVGTSMPAYGVIEIDSADIAGLEASGQLSTVVLHEMGHVLGIGTEWGSLLTGAGTSSPKFTGAVARGAWNAIGGNSAYVPVESGGGAGTADSHWSEAQLGSELMTGYLNSGTNPLSAITAGSLADIGYGVDLTASDAFGSPALRAPGTSIKLTTQLVHPIMTVP